MADTETGFFQEREYARKTRIYLNDPAPPLIFLSGFLTYILYHDSGVLLAFAGATNIEVIGFIFLLFIFTRRRVQAEKYTSVHSRFYP